MGELVCVDCSVVFTGIATAGMPCAMCLKPIVDWQDTVAQLAARVDVAQLVVMRIAVGLEGR